MYVEAECGMRTSTKRKKSWETITWLLPTAGLWSSPERDNVPGIASESTYKHFTRNTFWNFPPTLFSSDLVFRKWKMYCKSFENFIILLIFCLDLSGLIICGCFKRSIVTLAWWFCDFYIYPNILLIKRIVNVLSLFSYWQSKQSQKGASVTLV